MIPKQLALEAAIVGLTTMLAALPVAYVPQIRQSVTHELAYWFVMGIAIHLYFEKSGLNALYCRVGNACLPLPIPSPSAQI